MDQDAAFREHHLGPTWLRVVGIVAALLAIDGLAFGIPALFREWGSPGSWSLLAGMIVLIAVGGTGFTTLIWNTIDVAVCDGVAMAWLRPLRVLRIRLEDVAGVNATTVSPQDAAGLGFRWTPSGTYLLWRAGTAVEVRTRRGRTIFIQTDHPTSLQAALDPSSTTL